MSGYHNRKGITLILTTLVLAVLILLVMQMTITHQTHKTATENQINDLQNWYAVKSSYYLAQLYLKFDYEKSRQADHLNEVWAIPIQKQIGKSELTIYIEDAERKLNLSFLINQQGKVNEANKKIFERFLAYLGYPQEVADMVVDYIDSDDDGMYETNAINRPFMTTDEIICIKDIPREVLFGKTEGETRTPGIMEFITVWPKLVVAQGIPPLATWRINVNTAPKEVLIALSDKMTEQVADNIISRRQSVDEQGNYRYFKTVAELNQVDGMTPEIYNSIQHLLTTSSNFFEIKSVAKIATATKKWNYVVYRNPANGQIIPIASYQLSDFLFYKP